MYFQLFLVSNGGKFVKKTLIGEAYIWLDKVDMRKRVVSWHKLFVSSTQTNPWAPTPDGGCRVDDGESRHRKFYHDGIAIAWLQHCQHTATSYHISTLYRLCSDVNMQTPRKVMTDVMILFPIVALIPPNIIVLMLHDRSNISVKEKWKNKKQKSITYVCNPYKKHCCDVCGHQWSWYI